jgi:hypothetical protein
MCSLGVSPDFHPHGTKDGETGTIEAWEKDDKED